MAWLYMQKVRVLNIFEYGSYASIMPKYTLALIWVGFLGVSFEVGGG